MKTATAKEIKKIDPIELLRRTLAERCQKNPQYSIRAFARASGISHTVLSLVLSGKRGLSTKAVAKLADHLQLDPQQRQALMTKKAATPGEADYQVLSLDAFEMISDWYHYAILTLLELPHAVFDARWVAGQLGLNPLNAKLAMERLERLGLLEKNAEGALRPSGKPSKVDNVVSTAATRKFHHQLLQRAAVSIEQDPIPVRDFSSMTFAMDPNQVEYARTRIREFRRQLVAELESKGKPSAVYHFNLQMYPVTPIEKK
jgi:uncharacterized protein (TIGR02147 family)